LEQNQTLSPTEKNVILTHSDANQFVKELIKFAQAHQQEKVNK